VAVGLDGIECFHSKHSPATTQHYLALAQRFDLLITGGSDCHGLSKGQPLIGGVRLPAPYYDRFKAHRAAVATKHALPRSKSDPPGGTP